MPQGGSRTSVETHSERDSRELFTACDGDRDDRLDLFEACEAIETLGDPIDPGSFRTLDTDRDGYLGWPEFDAHFKGVIERGHPFHVRTCRRFVHSAPELQPAKAATPVEAFVQLHDKNENGGLDPEELNEIVQAIKLLPVFEAQLRMLDIDQSGLIEPAELAPLFDKIQPLVAPGTTPVQPPPSASSLPQPWGLIDANGDGSIDLEELRSALRRIDPGLARWAAYLLQKHDANADGKLQADELPTPPPPPPGTGDGGAGEGTTSLGPAGTSALVARLPRR